MKVGLDDFFAAGHTAAELFALAEDELRPPPEVASDEARTTSYFVENGVTYWNKPERDGTVPVQLADFSAKIIEDIIEDDGAETRRVYLIRAVVRGESRDIGVGAERFVGMHWPAEQLGPSAIVAAGHGSHDRLREAVQALSPPTIPVRRIYLHLGWIDHEGQSVYLHANGAIGANGVVAGIDVRLDAPLDRYALPTPPTGDELRAAVKHSLALLDGLASDETMFPLFSFVWTTTIRPLLETLHMTGLTGVRKTELLALAQRHFGESMDAQHLPLSWSCTGNLIEVVGFLAKDAVVGVDDYCPSGTAAQVQRLNYEADRVIRGRGNSAGRGRLRSDGTPRAPKPPRAGIVSTGEDTPAGHSLRARMIVVKVAEGEVNLEKLTERQAVGSAYSKAMAAFLCWFAARRPQVLNWFETETLRSRRQLLPRLPHGRTATAGAELIVGMQVFLLFAKEVGVLDEEQARALDKRSRRAICSVLARQAEHQAAADPTAVFVQMIGAALLSSEAHLADRKTGGVPVPECLARAAGWQRVESTGEGAGDTNWRQRGPQIGWLDVEDDAVFLIPAAAYRVAQKQGESSPTRIGIGERTLWDRLSEAGVLVSEDPDRHTKRTRIGDRTHGLLHLRLSHLLGESGTTGTEPDEATGTPLHGDLFSSGVPDPFGMESGTGALDASGPDGALHQTAEDAPVRRQVIDSEDAAICAEPVPTGTRRCLGCGHTRFWSLKRSANAVCGVCHPPTLPADQFEWIDVTAPVGGASDA